MIKKFLLGLGLLGLALIATGPVASAAQTVPYRLNYQGRLTDGSNNVKADGHYNMRFRIYNVSSGGSALWTETHDVAGGNYIDLKKGLFNVQLGTISSLSPSLFASQPLYLEIELPTPGTATSSSPSWTEGAMTPRHPLSSSPYALNADTIDGIDGASLAQLSANQTFSGDNTFTGTVLQQKTSSTAFSVQNAGGTTALLVDTSALTVKVGGGDNSPDGSPALLVLDYKNTTGDPSGTNGSMYFNLATKKFRCYESGAWGDCMPENRTRFEYRADFLSGSSLTNGTPIDNVLLAGSANSATFTRLSGELNHPGIIRLDVGTYFFQNGYVAIGSNYDAGNATAGVKFGGATWTISNMVRLNATSNATNNFATYNGYLDNLQAFTTNAILNGCLVIHNYQYNSGRWTGGCVAAGTATTCDPLDSNNQPLSAINTSAWYKLTTTVNAAATLATFVVEGNGQIGTCTVNANIPTAAVSFGTAMLRLAGTGAGFNMDVDYIETKTAGLSRN